MHCGTVLVKIVNLVQLVRKKVQHVHNFLGLLVQCLWVTVSDALWDCLGQLAKSNMFITMWVYLSSVCGFLCQMHYGIVLAKIVNLVQLVKKIKCNRSVTV